MKQLAKSEFSRLTKEELEEITPVEILFDGLPIGYFVKKDEVLVLADLHPRIQRRFRALEEKIRIGMPK